MYQVHISGRTSAVLNWSLHIYRITDGVNIEVVHRKANNLHCKFVRISFVPFIALHKNVNLKYRHSFIYNSFSYDVNLTTLSVSEIYIVVKLFYGSIFMLIWMIIYVLVSGLCTRLTRRFKDRGCSKFVVISYCSTEVYFVL